MLKPFTGRTLQVAETKVEKRLIAAYKFSCITAAEARGELPMATGIAHREMHSCSLFAL